MRLPILELDGYEADDVIGCLAQKAAKQNLDVLLITNDKDMMQLVDGSVRVLRTGPGGAKGECDVDAARVRKFWACRRNKVVGCDVADGRHHRQHPGAKGIGEKGAKELIQKYGKRGKCTGARPGKFPTNAIAKRCSSNASKVLLSKQLATLAAQVPLELIAEPGAARTGL